MVYGCDSYLLTLYLKKKTAYLCCLLLQAGVFAVAVRSHDSGHGELVPSALSEWAKPVLASAQGIATAPVSCDIKGEKTMSAAERGWWHRGWGLSSNIISHGMGDKAAAAWHLVLVGDGCVRGFLHMWSLLNRLHMWSLLTSPPETKAFLEQCQQEGRYVVIIES